MPAGEAIELGIRKSSRFIGSECCSFGLSTDFRSCAIPLGADVAANFFSSSFLHWVNQLARFEAKEARSYTMKRLVLTVVPCA
jgi:hypothetical protein